MAGLRGYDKGDSGDYRNIYGDLAQGMDVDSNIFGAYQPKSQDDYEEVEDTGAASDDSPVALTELPTSSLDASRPRTVAAGYKEYVGARRNGQAPLGKMTVMFRDGTLYNYYDVSPGEWASFRASISKGSPWLNKGFPNGKQQVDGVFIGKPRGPASLDRVAPDVLESIYRVARIAQVRFSNKRPTTVKGTTATGLPTTLPAPKKVRANAAKKVRAVAKAVNPHRNNGKNPYQK